MTDCEMVTFRERIDCRVVLERSGWTLDRSESSSRALKYRRGSGEIIIVTHQGRGWFDPLSENARGDVIALAQHVWGGTLGHARKNLRPLAGVVPEPWVESTARSKDRPPIVAAADWFAGNRLRLGSRGWSYLTDIRKLPADTIGRAMAADVLREGIAGTVWGAHRSHAGIVTGWEMRGPRYKGFVRDGAKSLFAVSVGPSNAISRLAVCESFIDALSLATIERWRSGTLYISTGGGWTEAAIDALTPYLIPQAVLVAATDQGLGGDLLAARLAKIAEVAGVSFLRLLPAAKDWNQVLMDGDREALFQLR